MKKLFLKALEPNILVRIIIIELIIWLLLIVPTVLYWKNSVAYLVFISVWAVIRTCLADLRIWHDEQYKDKTLIDQTEFLAEIHLIVDDIKKKNELAREENGGEGTKSTND